MGPELNQPLNPASRPGPVARQAAPAKPAAPATPEINQVTGFFDGFVKEGVQAATGVYTLLTTNPFKTASGLVYMATHPGQAVSAIVNPYVVAHQQGRYGEIGGRATFQVLSVVLGSGVASKKGTGAKVAEPTTMMSQQAAEVTQAMAQRVAKAKAARGLAEQGVVAGSKGYAQKLTAATKALTPEVAQSMATRNVADKLARQLAQSGLDDAAIGQMAAKASQSSVEQAHHLMVVGARHGLGPDKLLGILGHDAAQKHLPFVMTGIKHGVPTDDLLAMLGQPGAAKAMQETTRIMVEGARNAKLVASVSNLRSADAIATQLRRYDDLLIRKQDTAWSAAIAEQKDKLLKALQTEPRTAELVQKLYAGKPVGGFERIGAGMGAGLDDFGNAIGGGFQKISDSGKRIINHMDQPVTWGDYARGVRDFLPNMGRAIDNTARGVGDFLRQGLGAIELPTIKLPEINWSKIASSRAPNLADVGRAPFRAVGAMWNNPGKTIGYGTVIGNTVNLGRMGLRAASGEDITGAGAYYRANLTRAIDAQLDALTQQTAELDATRMALEAMEAADMLKGRKDLEKNLGIDLTKAPKDAEGLKAYVLKQFGEGFKNLAKARENAREFAAELEKLSDAELLAARPKIEGMGLSVEAQPGEAESYKAAVLAALGAAVGKLSGKEQDSLRKLRDELQGMSAEDVLGIKPQLDEKGLTIPLKTPTAKEDAASPQDAEAFKAMILKQVDEAWAQVQGPQKEAIAKLRAELAAAPAVKVLAGRAKLAEMGLGVEEPANGQQAGDVKPQDAEAFKAMILKQIDGALAQVKGPQKENIAKLRAELAAAPAVKVLAGRAELAEMGLGVEEPAKEQRPAGAKPGTGEGTKPASGEEAESYKRALLQEIDQRMAKTNGPDKQKLAQLKATLANAPAAEMLANRNAFDKMNLKVGAAPKPTVPGQSPVNAPGAVQTPAQYTVRPGDTLSDIAVNQMGGYTSWPQIQRANQGRYPTLANNPDYIRSGWQLQLPGRPATAQSQTPGVPTPAQAPAAPAPATQTGSPANAQAAAQRAQVTAQFGLEPSDANWANFQAEVASYATNAIGPDAGSKEDVQALQQLLGKLGFDNVKATGEFVEKDAQGQVRLDAQGQPMSPTGMAVVTFKRLAGLTQSYNVMGPDGKPMSDVNPYADATTLNAMGIALRLLQDPSLRTERASEAAVKEAARLAKEAVGAETGSLADRQTVQNALVANGYQVPTTGTFDEATIAAIIDFKRKNNLAAGFTNDRGEAVFTPYIDRREAEALLNQRAAAR